jgi:hypothetical protein
MPNHHKAPLLGWHPPAELSAWVREQAAREGVSISNVLSRAVCALRNEIAAMDTQHQERR